MKRFSNIVFSLCAIIGCLFFTACGGDDGEDAPLGGNEYLNVSDIIIPTGNTTATMYIKASANCDWTITCDSSWVSFSDKSGRGDMNVTVRVSQNPSSLKSRTADIRVSSQTITRTVHLTQESSTETLQISVSSLNFSGDVGSQTITVTGNTLWSVVENNEDWISVSPRTSSSASEVVTVSVSANPTESERRKVFTFKGQTLTQQLEVVQAGRSSDFSVSPKQLSSSALASSVQFNIVGSAIWTVKSSQDWAIPDVLSGEGDKTIIISLSDNTTTADRTAEVIVSSSSKTETITITQTAASLPTLVDLKSYGVGKDASTISFSFTSMFPVTEYGICYSSTNHMPDKVTDAYKLQAGSAKQGTATIQLTELKAGTTYYIRAYAVSAAGTQYSNAISFTTEDDWPGNDDNVTPGL